MCRRRWREVRDSSFNASCSRWLSEAPPPDAVHNDSGSQRDASAPRHGGCSCGQNSGDRNTAQEYFPANGTPSRTSMGTAPTPHSDASTDVYLKPKREGRAAGVLPPGRMTGPPLREFHRSRNLHGRASRPETVLGSSGVGVRSASRSPPPPAGLNSRAGAAIRGQWNNRPPNSPPSRSHGSGRFV